MTISNIISAIGNNSSVYPLIVRDCGIEVPTKIALTYNQNKKESKGIAYLAARERFLDEYATSAVWLGGIPFVGWIANKYIKARGLNSDVNLKLFKEEQGIQGIDYNIKKFKDLAPDAVKDLVKAKENKKLFEKLLAGKFIASMTIPILFMGFILPKLIFASSAKKIQNLREKEAQSLKNNAQVSFLQKERFYKRAAERDLGDSADEVYENASNKAKTHIHPTAAKADIILSGEADRAAYRKFINQILELVKEIYF